jgi:undecaprenyl-diphosphatase
MLSRLRHWRSREGWGEFVLLLAGFTFALMVWLFAELADDAVPGEYLDFETKILRAFRQPDNPAIGIGPHWVPSVVRDLTALGSVVGLALLVSLIIGFLVMRGRRRAALLIFLASVGGVSLGSGFKSIFERSRPEVVPHLMEVTSLSFPSGHSMMSSTVYLTLGALLGQTVARRREKIYIIAAAVLLTILVGLSRVYLGVHYPTDVLAGWAAGTAWALLCWMVAWWLQRRGAMATPEEAAARNDS